MRNNIEYLLVAALALFMGMTHAQTINWGSLENHNHHIINANFGAEYGIIYGLGYGYHFNTKLFDIVPNVEYSFPSGNNIFDDFKAKPGVQIRWVGYKHFHFSTKIQAIFRRHDNDFARLINFGSDLSGIVGYYRLRWHIAGEFGFDKAIVTHFKHSNLYRDQYQGVIDGWYEPPTGGNFYFGVQAGYSSRKHDLYLKGGPIFHQDFKTNPLLPFYLQLGYNFRG